MKNKSTIKKALKYIGKYKYLLPVSILLALVTVALTLYVPILIGDAIYILCARVMPYDDSVVSATPLLTQKSTGIESTDK